MARLARRTAAITPFRVVDVMEAAWAAERAGRSIVHLEVGEPDFGTPPPVVEAASKAIADGRVRYTSSLGLPELREAISGYYADRFGVDVPARRAGRHRRRGRAARRRVLRRRDLRRAGLRPGPGHRPRLDGHGLGHQQLLQDVRHDGLAPRLDGMPRLGSPGDRIVGPERLHR